MTTPTNKEAILTDSVQFMLNIAPDVILALRNTDRGPLADLMEVATRELATVAASPSVQGESIDSERAAFEAEEIAHWQQAQSHPLTDEEKKFLLRPANSLSSGDYYACEDRWIGWKRRARLARTAAPDVESSIAALVAALQASKGWMRDYADSLIRDAIARTAAPSEHNSQDPRCSCPSGSGDLRWPCLVHPPKTAAAPSEQQLKLEAGQDAALDILEAARSSLKTRTERLERLGIDLAAPSEGLAIPTWQERVASSGAMTAGMNMQMQLNQRHMQAEIADLRAILAAQPVPQASGERDTASDIKWPPSYCTDPNGVVIPPDGKHEDFSFGYNLGYADGFMAIKDSVKIIEARVAARIAATTSKKGS